MRLKEHKQKEYIQVSLHYNHTNNNLGVGRELALLLLAITQSLCHLHNAVVFFKRCISLNSLTENESFLKV